MHEHFVSVFTKEGIIERSVWVYNILGKFEIKKEVVLGLLKSNLDKSHGSNDIYPRLFREEIAGTLTKILISTLATCEIPEV